MNKNKKIIYIFALFLLPVSIFSAPGDPEDELLNQLPPDQRKSVIEKMNKAEDLELEIEEAFEKPGTLIERPERDSLKDGVKECDDCIFGYEFFQFAPTTFAPTDNAAISADYILGPGDSLAVNLYGNIDKTYKGYISREGLLNIPSIGPVGLAGMSFKEASIFLQEKIKKELIGTSVYLSLAELRSISIYVLGQAYKPGKYTISGLSSLTNALFISGGVNEYGSLRKVQVRRNNKIIGEYDFYTFLLKGSLETDIQLRDGDVIFIPFIKNKVKLGGAFNRPDLYEFLEGETLEDAIFFAGGYKSDVLSNSSIEISSVDRKSAKRNIYSVLVNEADLTRKLLDGDSVNVSGNSGVKVETIVLSGAIQKPGEYAINQGDTILDIIQRAGGYTQDSFSEGSVFTRVSVAKEQKAAFLRTADELERTLINIVQEATTEAGTTLNEFSLSPVTNLILRLREIEPIGRQTVELDLIKLRSDPYVNFNVRDGDKLFVPKRPNSVSVVGEVLNATTLRYIPENSVADYVNLAGGLTNEADKDRLYVIGPDGQAEILKQSLFSKTNNIIIPGSTIVAARNSKPWDAIKLTQVITPILADLATSAAAIAAISD
tara:strand:+ start:1539 stop:3350 length:1812 start_codon:yes stop_codon:yes gene_type:complete